MTFGEHLEDLRKCLVKAMLGATVGVVIGLCFGDHVVRFIQTPMEKSLKEYYGKKAKKDVETKYQGFSPELLAVINDHGLVPDEAQIEPLYLLEQIAANSPGKIALTDWHGYPFSDGDLSDAADLAGQLVKAGDNAEPIPLTRYWRLLSDTEKTRVKTIAKANEATDEQKSELAVAISRILSDRSIYDEPLFDRYNKSLGPLEKIALPEAIRERFSLVEPETDETEIRILNWFLLDTLSDEAVLAPHPEMISIRLWKRLETDPRTKIKTLNAQEAFTIWLKASIMTGVVISSPWIFFHVWTFVAAGLYPHERRYIHVFLPFSLVLFWAGAALAFFFVFGYVLDFLFGFNERLGIDPDPRISEWLGFAMFLPIGFGVSFQLPLVMLFMERIGIFSAAIYKAKIRIAILVIAVLSMLLTPADPMSMLLMLVPLTLLYFLGIGLCTYMPRNRSPYGAGQELE
jgi:sec-independent protein translocase protein TatC